jgi:hypothetical protein
MTQTTSSSLDDCVSPILSSQYNALIRRSSRFEGERRLLWAVLEDAIDTYLVSIDCGTAKQREAYEEIRDWFLPSTNGPDPLFSFPTICDLLDINGRLLLKAIESMREKNIRPQLRRPRHREVIGRRGRLAA